MLNVLIISNEAEKICASHRSTGLVMSAAEPSSPPASDTTHPADIAFLDLEVPDWQGRLLALRQLMPVVAFSKPDINAAVEAMKLGASDYLAKPLTETALAEVISRYKKRLLNQRYGFDEIIGMSTPMQEVFGLIKRAAASESNVLVTGESGTGKELIARAIHRWSPRSERAFMSINCSAIPDTLLESELFGFEKGSFTGANYTKKGLLETAHGGTVFFDEIGDVSPMFQIKVLRVLQEGEIMRVGGVRQIQVDVRVIAATNRDLAEEVRKGRFREDLYYRLKVFPIQIPPLRDRIEDLPLLVFAFMEEFAARMGKKITKIPRKAMEILQGHSWPGNIRELRNVIEHSAILTTGDTLKLTILGEAPIREAQPMTLAEAERDHILKTLENTRWRIKGPHGAAARLDLQPSTLYSRMQKLGIPHRRQKDEMTTNGIGSRPS